MSRQTVLCLRAVLIASVGFASIGAMDSVGADHHSRRARRSRVVNRARPAYAPGAVQPAPLGTFMPTPVVTIRGNDPVGGGYSPLGIYGDQSMSFYGPFSPFRSVTAPIVVYSRGYDGVVRSAEVVTSSYPNLPALSPVVYPTRANNYYGPRIMEDPRSTTAIDWLDQN
jgi:hypothetical protein